ncbi:MAG: hypothetical protein FJW31_04455 [Acidobacteria bacterium]|nr:hypothetical protein [Acidobacteriota bacterium]
MRWLVGLAFISHKIFSGVSAEVAEAAEGAVELAREARFVAFEEREGAGVVERELANAGGGAECAIDVGAAEFDFVVHARPLFVDEGALHGPGAEETPAADSHLFDEERFGGGGGLELVGEGLVDDDELGAVFDVEAGELGGEVRVRESVAAGVAGAAGLAFGSDGAAGLGAVGAGGGALGFGGFATLDRPMGAASRKPVCH